MTRLYRKCSVLVIHFFAQFSFSSCISLHWSLLNPDLSSSACPDFVTMATEVGSRRSMMPVWPFGPFACRSCCPHMASPARQVIGALTSIKKWCNVRSELLSSISAWLKILDCCFFFFALNGWKLRMVLLDGSGCCCTKGCWLDWSDVLQINTDMNRKFFGASGWD